MDSQISSENTLDFEKLKEIIKNLLPEEDQNIIITKNTTLADLEFDSIRYMHLLLSLEDIIGKDIDEIIDKIDLSSLHNINDILELIQVLKK